MILFFRKIYFRIIKAKKIIFLLIFLLAFFGFFYLRNVDRMEFYQKYHREVQFVKKLSNVVYLPKMFFPVRLERYDLKIAPKDLIFLNNNLPELYAGKILTSDYKKPVKAKFIVKGKEYDVEVRYRGDTDVHWRDPKKSWLIRFKADDYFENKKRIHLIIPEDRNYLVEELNFYRAKKMGLLTPETRFVNLFINGNREGAYWQMEDWGKDLLERQNIPGDVNLYSSKDFVEVIGPYNNPFSALSSWQKDAQETLSAVDNYSDLKLLLDTVNNPSDQYFNENIGNIIDLENFYWWKVHQDLMSSTHQIGTNMRFYFDSTKGKFMFIPWDVAIFDPPPPNQEKIYNPLVTRILKNPVFLQERNKRLWQYVSNEKNLADDLRFYDSLDRLTKNDFYKDWKKVESNFAYRKKIASFKEQIKEKFYELKNNLENANAALILEANLAKPELKVNINTTGFSSVQLKNIEIKSDNCESQLNLYEDTNKNGSYDNSDKLLKKFLCQDNIYFTNPDFLIYAVKDDSGGEFLKPGYNSATLFIVSDSLRIKDFFTEDKLKFSLSNAITGQAIKNLTTNFVLENLNFNPSAASLTLAEFVQRNPIFSINKGNLFLGRGNYLINEDIIIPRGTRLVIESGTVFQLAEGSSLLSYSPILAAGTAKNPIVFYGLENSRWGSVGIISAAATSTFDYVIMAGGGDDYINGIYLSGMLSVYHSPVIIKNSEFKKSFSDDGVNIKYGFSEITNNRFENNSADGLDLDVTNAVVDSNTFIDNGNDGIDLSSLQPIIKNNKIRGSQDKCISVGENSSPVLFNNLLVGCNIGVAAKDYSKPIIVNNTIVGNKIGIGGYQKKPIFGGSLVIVINSVIWDNEKPIELDEKSQLKVTHSVISGGYSGEANIDQDPALDSNFIIDRTNEVNQVLNREIYSKLGSDFSVKEIVGYSE